MKCEILGGFFDLGKIGGIHVTGNQNESATTHQKNSKQQQAEEPAGESGCEAQGACDDQGWARRLRDLDVRGGAAEGTAPWPCVGV
jgi:hypothetical protein